MAFLRCRLCSRASNNSSMEMEMQMQWHIWVTSSFRQTASSSPSSQTIRCRRCSQCLTMDNINHSCSSRPNSTRRRTSIPTSTNSSSNTMEMGYMDTMRQQHLLRSTCRSKSTHNPRPIKSTPNTPQCLPQGRCSNRCHHSDSRPWHSPINPLQDSNSNNNNNNSNLLQTPFLNNRDLFLLLYSKADLLLLLLYNKVDRIYRHLSPNIRVCSRLTLINSDKATRRYRLLKCSECHIQSTPGRYNRRSPLYLLPRYNNVVLFR